MATKQDINTALNKMILSASGWRGVFAANGDEESKTAEITEAYGIIAGAAAFVFAEYLRSKNAYARPEILLAADTRPTGQAVIDTVIPVLLSAGCDILYAGVCAAPEIMAWARSERKTSMIFAETDDSVIPIGFIYISASHNPIGHNGIKFGLADGGVLTVEEAEKLIDAFRSFLDSDSNIEKIKNMISEIPEDQIQAVKAVSEISKVDAYKTYYEFCTGTAFGDTGSSDSLSFVLSVSSVVNKNLGIVCDFNGSARTVSIDKDIFTSLGLKFDSINNEPGAIAHRIVPEGESLEPCRIFLEEAHAKDPSFVIGYVPDCDGDRGNLVIWDNSINKARALEAQEVFALACVSELAYQVWTGEEIKKAAVAVNDPTSMRVDRIAQAFGVEVFRAEVGEANVVGLARRLREEGYTVRILGEGSAGGNITHPSAVRDPMHTVLALVKLLCIRDRRTELREEGSERPGLFEIWCEHSGQMDKYHEDFTLADIIASLPQFITTGVYEKNAVLCIQTADHTVLKNKYQKVFEREWENKKDELKSKLGICKWEAIAYNGLEEKRSIKQFGEAGKGGLKLLFLDSNNKPAAFIWMRGSATEPVFRIMADVEGTNKEAEQLLLNWQRSMIMEADKE
ncbi:MAG: phosphatidylglycerol lysyltransferase [Treponema sp.]|nr:phosphatidylglycerol lysyltransferase [Treponema sp.]